VQEFSQKSRSHKTPNSRRQNGNTKQVSYWEPTDKKARPYEV